MWKWIKKKFWYVFDEKLNDWERYHVALILSKFERLYFRFLLFLHWLFKHNKLSNIVIWVVFLIVIYIFLIFLYYFFAGFNFFLEKVGLEQIVDYEKRFFDFALETLFGTEN